MSSTPLDARNPFAPTPYERGKANRAGIAKWSTLATCLLLALPLICILIYIFYRGSSVLSWDYINRNPFDKGKQGGLWAPLIGTFYLVISSLLIVSPIGVLAAIYLNEYAKDGWLNRVITMTVTSLAGVPSIVHALFGVGAFVLGTLPAVNSLLGLTGRDRWEAGLLTASMTVAVMNLPVIITAAREALGSVPVAFREACWNLGASRWQTIRTVVLPNSLSGILTGIILSVSRAAGETAPILFTGATFYRAVADTGIEKFFPYAPGEPFLALSYHLNMISNQVSQMPDNMKYGCASVLIVLILFVNSFAVWLRTVLRKRKRW